MNYQRVYDNIIQSAQLRPDIPFLNGYTEKHHIIPHCLGGSDDPSNLVKLTAREHFIAHWLLWCIYPKNTKLAYAFNMMRATPEEKRYYSSLGYAIAKKAAAIARSIDTKGKPSNRKNYSHNAQTREKISIKNMGRRAWNKGITIPGGTKKWSKARENVDAIREAYDSGESIISLRRKYNCGFTTIKDIIAALA